MSNIITATFSGETITRTEPIYQIDYGMVIKFEGVELPDNYEVVFEADGQACTMLGNEDGCPIPTAYIQTGQTIYARVFLHTGENDGYVEYVAVIPNQVAIAPTDEPTPEQESVISQLITLIEAAQEQTAEDARTSGENASAAEGYATTASNKADEAGGYASDALGCKNTAVQAKDDAVQAKSDAVQAKNDAVSAKEAAEQAKADTQALLATTIYLDANGIFQIHG